MSFSNEQEMNTTNTVHHIHLIRSVNTHHNNAITSHRKLRNMNVKGEWEREMRNGSE